MKARDLDSERSLAVCESLGAEARGVLNQRDTYFRVPRGRLKLREEARATAQLIAYERSDLAEQRESDYRIVAVEDAEGLKVALAAALGVSVTVAKERRLFIWEGVRIHLDRVEGLGHFLEFEAVTGEGALDLAAAEKRVEELRRAFGLEADQLVGESYCDLAPADPNA
ncbi:MAG TPA: class IV adenylate cyclase [Solirubrobacterales bacterium]|nr:class IV adenylate cyclase [Solirubrobacterales bacterium]